jgi:two-component system chemotaxis response regulator CheB
MEKKKVLIVDDSAVVRGVLTELLSASPELEVVATAEDPYDARDKIKTFRPDVITLDIEMPKMDGITFLRNLMKLNPMPVVMLSSLTHEGAEATLEALEIGAVDFMPKPTTTHSDDELQQFQRELIEKVKSAASSSAKIKFMRQQGSRELTPKAPPMPITNSKVDIILIGSSTGGTEAVRDLLAALPDNMPPIAVTQHIPASFSDRFAKRLNEQCQNVVVKEAQEGDILKPGHAYIAPGGYHLNIKKRGFQWYATLDTREQVNRHKPSVEVMFDSVLELDIAERTVAIMLTGMGDDGAVAMKRLYDAGSHTIAQDESSSLVWGMPGTCVRLGATNEVLALDKIPARLVEYITGK